MPPPPPPPPAPSGLPKAPKIKSGGGGTDRSALLTSIQGGAKLKKTVTNDRSAPVLGGNKRSSGGNKFNTVAAPVRKPPTRDLPGTWRGSKDDGNTNRPSPPSSSGGGGGGGGGGSSGPSGGGPMGLGGLFAGGMPQLRKTGANTGGGPPKRLAMPVPGSANKPANNGPAARFGQNSAPAPGSQNGRRMVNGGPPNAFPPPPPPQNAKPAQNVAPPPPPSQDSKPNRPISGVRRTESIENDKNVSRNPQTIAGVINRGQPPPPPSRPVPTSSTNGRPSSMVGRPLPPTPPSLNGSAPVAPPKVAPPPPPRQQPGRPSAPPPPVRNTSMQQRPPPPPRQDPPPPPPHMGRPPPPPMSQPPSATRSRSSIGSNNSGGDSFEQRFKFHSINEFPHPEKPNIAIKSYPSNTRRPSQQQRRAPPPPPPPS